MPIEFTGDTDFIKAMQKKAKALTDKNLKKKILNAGAEPIRKAMAEKAPRGVKNPNTWESKAGKKYAVEHLKDNIIVSDIKENDTVEVGPESHFFYAKMLEFGTSKMAAQPFAEPGYLEKRNEAIEAMANETKKVIENL